MSLQQPTNYNEDENDSNLVIKTRRFVRAIEEGDYEEDHSSPTKHVDVDLKRAPIISQKQTNTMMPKLIQVRPITRAQQKSPNRNRIDKIADNLKINILQKDKTAPLPPKVSVVAVHKLKESPGKLNQTAAPPLLLNTQIKPDGGVAYKKLVNSYHKLIIENLEKKQEKENDNEELNELTNLSWLNTFNLASTGLKPISPPPTPPRPVTLFKQAKIPTTKLAPLLTKPIINPFIKKTVPGVSVVDDESDGCYSLNRKPLSSVKLDMASLIKPWLALRSTQQRPPYSFSCLTFMAIETSGRKRLSVKEIYTWVTENFPYYQSVPSGSWKNSIRHNLSLNGTFCKVDKNLLAMRDFSGKGSLWCVDPEIRSKLLEAIGKLRPNEQLSSISYLQDATETTRNSLLLSDTPVTSQLVKSTNSSPQKKAVGFGTTKRKPMQEPPVLLRMTNANKMPAAYINPKIANVSGKLSTSLFSTISSVQNNYKHLSFNNQHIKNDECSELDAVKALLSMKSRSSSMPSAFSSHSQSKYANQQQQQNQNLNLNQIASKLTQNVNDITAKGRRKQLFKPPTKKRLLDDDDDDDDDHNNEVDEDESFVEDYYLESEFQDEIDNQNANITVENRDEEQFKTKKSKIFDSKTFKMNLSATNKKNTKKLLVKFSSFKNSLHNKLSKEAARVADNQYLKEAAGEIDEGEAALKIDESFSSDQEAKPPVTRNKRKLAEVDYQLSKASKSVKTNKADKNSLLELSRVACLVEDKN